MSLHLLVLMIAGVGDVEVGLQICRTGVRMTGGGGHVMTSNIAASCLPRDIILLA